MAAPIMYLFWPFVDPAVATMLPSPLNGIGVVARAWNAVFGNVRLSVVPQAVCGAAFVAGVVRSTWRARRKRSPADAVRTSGLALAWFGIAVSALIALTRIDYFTANPSQVYAPRYLPWSSLAWAGWLMALVAERLRPRAMRAVVAAVGPLALRAEVGMTRIMRHHADIAADTALAAVVGVSPGQGETGESDVRDVAAGASAMRRLGAGPYAWPEAALIGSPSPSNAGPLVVDSWEEKRVYAGADSHGLRLEAVVRDPACRAIRLLVLDRGTVVGLLRPVDENRWRGVARLDSPGQPLEVAALGCAQ